MLSSCCCQPGHVIVVLFIPWRYPRTNPCNSGSALPLASPSLGNRISATMNPDISFRVWLGRPRCRRSTGTAAQHVNYTSSKMVDPVGFEPTVSAMSKRRSRPAELRVEKWWTCRDLNPGVRQIIESDITGFPARKIFSGLYLAGIVRAGARRNWNLPQQLSFIEISVQSFKEAAILR